MAYYRLYFLNALGHIHRAVDWECADDAAALDIANGHLDGRACELWRGDRRVAVFGAELARRREGEPLTQDTPRLGKRIVAQPLGPRNLRNCG